MQTPPRNRFYQQQGGREADDLLPTGSIELRLVASLRLRCRLFHRRHPLPIPDLLPPRGARPGDESLPLLVRAPVGSHLSWSWW